MIFCKRHNVELRALLEQQRLWSPPREGMGSPFRPFAMVKEIIHNIACQQTDGELVYGTKCPVCIVEKNHPSVMAEAVTGVVAYDASVNWTKN